MVYRVSNWSTYNQALIDRGSLTVWLSEEALSGWHSQGPTQRGAQFFYSDLAIETTLTLRKLFDLGLRQSQGLVTSLFALMRVDLKAPSYSTLSRRQAELKIELPVRSKEEPIHLVVDSSGLKIFGEGEWKVRQQGWTKRRNWRKRQLGCRIDPAPKINIDIVEPDCGLSQQDLRRTRTRDLLGLPLHDLRSAGLADSDNVIHDIPDSVSARI